jgi:guanosine-3',5'-bis(diphosphate) 3'-pyrophosphohydrolase
MPDALHALLDAVAFACRAHRDQLRKDGQTPYASHVLRVAFIARQQFGVDDSRVLTAAVLHDTLEDTTTDYDDLSERFGDEIAGWVALLSKDARLPEERREEAYRASLASAPWQVKVCKLADVYDNLLDSAHLTAERRSHALKRIESYLQALDRPDLPPLVRAAWERVRRLLTESGPGHVIG